MVFLSRSLVPILHRWDGFVPMKFGRLPHVCYVEWWLWNVQVPWQLHVRRSFWSNETNETRLRQFGFSWPKNARIGTLEVARVFLVEVAGNEKSWKLVSKKIKRSTFSIWICHMFLWDETRMKDRVYGYQSLMFILLVDIKLYYCILLSYVHTLLYTHPKRISNSIPFSKNFKFNKHLAFPPRKLTEEKLPKPSGPGVGVFSGGTLGSIGDLFTSLGAPAAELGKEYGLLKDRKNHGGIGWWSLSYKGTMNIEPRGQWKCTCNTCI